MKSEIIKLKEAKEYNENPFLKGLNVPIVPKSNMFISKDKNIVNIKTGELDEDVLLTGKRKYVDGEQFIKIFVKEIEAIFDLSKASQKLFAHMLSKIRYDDLLILSIEECLEKTGYKSKGPIFKSLAELIQKEFIAKTKNQFVYWINPKLFYKGDRLVIMREYNKTREIKIENKNQLSLFEEDPKYCNSSKREPLKLEAKDEHIL
jgi:Firmicute plasmid replication protein (RepL)